MTLKVLILGASGFLGRNLVTYWRKHSPDLEVIPFSRTSVDKWQDNLSKFVSAGKSARVINCAAMSDPAECERKPKEAAAANTQFALEAGRFCEKLKVPFIQISSDGLFPVPEHSPRYWTLADEPSPITTYGRTKRDAEIALGKLGWGQCVRLSFVGPGLGTTRGLISFLANSIHRSDQPIHGFTDIWFTPLHVDDVAEKLGALLKSDCSGFKISHWGSFPAQTKHDFISAVLRAAAQNVQVLAVKRSELPGLAPVPTDQSLKAEEAISSDQLVSKSAQSLREELMAIAANRAKA